MDRISFARILCGILILVAGYWLWFHLGSGSRGLVVDPKAKAHIDKLNNLPDVVTSDFFESLSVKVDGQELVGSQTPVELVMGRQKVSIFAKVRAKSAQLKAREKFDHFVAVLNHGSTRWNLYETTGGLVMMFPLQDSVYVEHELSPGVDYEVRIYACLIDTIGYDSIVQGPPYRYLWVGSGHAKRKS